MSENRFEVGKGDKGLLIYDNEGLDDYYFVNDKEELQQFVDLINNQPDIVDELKKELDNRKKIIKAITAEYIELGNAFNDKNKENEQLKKQLNNVQILYKSTDDNLFASRKTNKELRECYSKLEEENQKLKQRITELELLEKLKPKKEE